MQRFMSFHQSLHCLRPSLSGMLGNMPLLVNTLKTQKRIAFFWSKNINPFMPNRTFSPLWTGAFLIEGMSVFLLFPCFVEIPVFNANSVDPDQTSVVSDLGLYCLQMFPRRDVKFKWVNSQLISSTNQ